MRTVGLARCLGQMSRLATLGVGLVPRYADGRGRAVQGQGREWDMREQWHGRHRFGGGNSGRRGEQPPVGLGGVPTRIPMQAQGAIERGEAVLAPVTSIEGATER
jgi:hypothetical protein